MKSTHLRLSAAVLVIATALAIFGITRLVQASTPSADQHTLTIEDLTAEVAGVKWTKMDHEMDGSGFQMPPQMMPGMPQGEDQRLAVEITVTNTSGNTRALVVADEFALHAGSGKPVAPKTHTFGELPRLAPNTAVTGLLFFDLSPAKLADSPAWLEWRHGNDSGRLSLEVGKAPEHNEHN